MATRAGFKETDTGRIAIVATEAATNISRHGGGGEMVMRAVGGEAPVFEMLALDRGPGMADFSRCLQDGYSTSGSAGTGLGAIRRLSTEWDVYTAERQGTALLSRIYPAPSPPGVARPTSRFQVGAVSVPLRGEQVCGDDWAITEEQGRITLMVVDGLGHGSPAAESAMAAIASFCEGPRDAPSERLRRVHAAMRSTRGGAVSIAQRDPEAALVRFAGVGNVAGLVGGPGNERHMVALPGIAGHDIRRVREFTYPCGPHDLLLLYSDGISTHWSLDPYGSLANRDATLIAGVLYRDWARERDDATVVVLKLKA
jgi:anti-sigma regulatory factor (Ser/Thr protein kinase)